MEGRMYMQRCLRARSELKLKVCSTGILSLSIGGDTAHSVVVHVKSYYLYFLSSYTGLYYLVSLLQSCNTKKRDTCIPRDPCILAYLPHY